MPTYRISNTTSGHTIGSYVALDERDAIRVMDRDAGVREDDSDFGRERDDLLVEEVPAGISAKITGRGIASTVPDNDGAVDATIYEDGIEIGEVTLLPSPSNGSLDTWGSIDNWASDAMARWLKAQRDEDGDEADRTGEVIAAVEEAASAE